ncbi:hypothetical protein K438DRAFT_187495 [Mycena galopus ATCC 62051]|nr:hypothetical protein K438DRAFT_187495 [Mycena galopus ATCC 62051]
MFFNVLIFLIHKSSRSTAGSQPPPPVKCMVVGRCHTGPENIGAHPVPPTEPREGSTDIVPVLILMLSHAHSKYNPLVRSSRCGGAAAIPPRNTKTVYRRPHRLTPAGRLLTEVRAANSEATDSAFFFFLLYWSGGAFESCLRC